MLPIYEDVGCGQEDHLPGCAHFGFTGLYLSAHLPCNPEARRSAGTARRHPCSKLAKPLRAQ